MKPHVRSLIELIIQYVDRPNLVGAEVGVWKGETSQELLTAFPTSFLFLVDLWKEWLPGSTYYDQHKVMGRMPQAEWDLIYNQAVHNTRARPGVGTVSILRKDTGEAASYIANGILDYVFLDASHYYDDVKRDIDLWTPKVKVGGLIAGHDFKGKMDTKGIWGISRAVHEKFTKERVIEKPGLVWAVIKTEAD